VIAPAGKLEDVRRLSGFFIQNAQRQMLTFLVGLASMTIKSYSTFIGKLKMSKKVSITLDDEVLSFVDRLASNRSSFINGILLQEKRRIFMQELGDAYKEQANDPMLQEEVSLWDVTVEDGLNA
jgi:hypothetical protein